MTAPLRAALVLIGASLACSRGDTIVAPAIERHTSPPVVTIEIEPDVVLTGPLVVRKGYLRVSPFDVAHAVFEGHGFRIEARGIEPGVSTLCFPCDLPGSVGISSSFQGSFLGEGPASVGGQQFSRLSYGGGIDIAGDPVMLGEGRAHGVVVAPITLTAFIKGYLGSAFIPDPPDPSIDVQLSGQGMAKITFQLAGDRGSRIGSWETLEYIFLPSRR